tara:strand:+ start:263 stop:595 length:333 start_codon:yes stop_codon:yes gene_type:complete
MFGVLKGKVLIGLLSNDDELEIYDDFQDLVIENSGMNFDTSNNRYLVREGNIIHIYEKVKTKVNYYIYNQENIEIKKTGQYELIRAEINYEDTISSISKTKYFLNSMIKK